MSNEEILAALDAKGDCESCDGCGGTGFDPRAMLRAVQAVGHLVRRWGR